MSNSRIPTFSFSFLILLMLIGTEPAKSDQFLTLASTTSTRDTGLLDSILPMFTEESGIEVRVLAIGTGQAIRLAKNGDADVLLVHHQKSEKAFVESGFGVKRYEVMHNDFVLIGPSSDSAGINGMQDIIKALSRIAEKESLFVSRGDDSGTNKKERDLWLMAGIDKSLQSSEWYIESGSGMGATLNIAVAMNGYTLSDRGTWLAFKNKGTLKILVQNDKHMRNPYGVILVNPARHPHIKASQGQKLIDWLISKKGKKAISDFTINGEQLFKVN